MKKNAIAGDDYVVAKGPRVDAHLALAPDGPIANPGDVIYA